MRLAHFDLSAPIHWKENKIPVVVVESPALYRQWVFELKDQAEGGQGPFVLSKNFEPLDCASCLKVIWNYHSLNMEERGIQNQFQNYLNQIVASELAQESMGLVQQINQFAAAISIASEYPISFELENPVGQLLKALKIKPALDAENPMERLMQYLEICSGLKADQCFVLISAHAFFTKQELKMLYQMAAYRKWNLLLLENRQSVPVKEEEMIVVDKDLCEIRT